VEDAEVENIELENIKGVINQELEEDIIKL
jgi:hypothetical protein